MLDVIAIGDTTIDVFMIVEKHAHGIALRKKDKKLLLDYGSKIPVRETHRVVAVGNAANHAVGASRLGLRAAIYTHVGADTCGADMVHQFSRERVLTRYIVEDKGKRTNYSNIIAYENDRTILVYHENRSYRLPRLPAAKYLYFSSIHGNHLTFNRELIAYVKRSGVRLAFNPGTMQMELGTKKLSPVLNVCDILFVNREEALRLIGRESENDRKLLTGLQRLGPRHIVMTKGAEGAAALFDDVHYTIPAPPCDVIERTGCGDAFGSGFLSSYITTQDVSLALRWGSLNAMSVSQHIGSRTGLLTRHEMDQLVKKHPRFLPTQDTV